MKIIITGASGLVGRALVGHLRQEGHTVSKLVRKKQSLQQDERFWDPAKGQLDPQHLAHEDAVINLSGENLASGFWTESKKKRIVESRLSATQLIATTLAQVASPSKILINASAVGYYGDRGSEILTEESAPGEGFLADTCRQWELATEAAEKASLRVVHLRLGVILSKEGGLLKKLLMPFQLGLGCMLGPGTQYISWIAIDDLVRIISFILVQNSINGAINAVSPNPVSNREFTKILGEVVKRPTCFTVPAFAIKFLGEMGQEMILSSTRAVPVKLQQHGYPFIFPDLKPAFVQQLS